MSEPCATINVTKTFLPPLDDYINYLEGVWERGQVTNNGPLVKELEARLKEFLSVKHIFFVSNGTMALQIAIKSLGLSGEIITTPFSYVATTSSIVWEGCTPVFVDIDPETLNIDPDLLEAAITPRTTAILAVHVYGHPCDVHRIQAIADRHRLKVIYDAAHAFGVRYNEQSLLVHGDVSALSFHATKLFHTVEGGALVTNDDDVAHRITYMRNFGHKGQEGFWGLGINGKNSEIGAAMGLCVLPHVPRLIAERGAVDVQYTTLIPSHLVARPKTIPGTVYNYAYYPVLFETEEQLLAVRAALNARQIYPRRYFHPSLNWLEYLPPVSMPVSEAAASRVLCLPQYASLSQQDVMNICSTIRNTLIATSGQMSKSLAESL